MTSKEFLQEILNLLDSDLIESYERHEDMGEKIPVARFASAEPGFEPDGVFVELHGGETFEIIVR